MCWLFVDIVFLIVFGILAFFITAARDIDDLMWRANLFMVAGLAWSVIALVWRDQDRAIASKWLVIDGVQIGITYVLYLLPLEPLSKAVPLALVNLACSFADLRVIATTR